MARVALSEGARADLDRLFEFLAADDLRAAAEALDIIVDALEILRRHPLVGRPCEEGLRELVISRGRTGYVALYEFFEAEDVVLVLALRHQREAGFPD
ncbi:MAG: type II toxin-antitoxin system RelE/ParE family toxin [Burkholderiales bacterium]|nr:type II toxin-antitoxin system RelE/ParE family toxin [Burkholderiales bacterium]